MVISSGFHKTHVTTAAGEAWARGRLALAITSIYPTARVKRVVRFLKIAGNVRVGRILEREERIPDDRLHSLMIPEFVDALGRVLGRMLVTARLGSRMSDASWGLYGRLAARQLRRVEDANIYHFRAGFGQSSVAQARRLGMLVLCDHAIAHPSALPDLINNKGRLGPHADRVRAGEADVGELDPRAQTALADIDSADAVVVNSDFVKETFVSLGWPPDRVHVVYLGVDDNFLSNVRARQRTVPLGPLRLLFAGRLERRKGADVLIETLRDELNDVDWQLLIAGPLAPEVVSAYGAFLRDKRVTLLGTLSRAELARQMAAVPVFIFPSLAEGSARVVFEALASGCYVITTPNAGTIVEDRIHGALVPPGDRRRLADAIVEADRDRRRIVEIGARNAEVVAAHYSQRAYGDALAELYQRLLNTRAPVRSR